MTHAYGQIAVGTANIASGATVNITPGDLTLASGDNLGIDNAGILRSILHSDDITISRTVDVDQDSTFEINEQITSRSGGGEYHSATHPITQYAGVEVTNDSASAQDIVFIAEYADTVDVFVESGAGIADGAEVTRTTASRATDESILELVVGGSADLDRRFDANDDGTFEVDQNVASYASQTVVSETWLNSVDVDGRTNPAFQNALVNTSGGPADYAIIGTITDA